MKREVLEGIVEITQKEFQDDRGSFMESFNSKQFNNSLKIEGPWPTGGAGPGESVGLVA